MKSLTLSASNPQTDFFMLSRNRTIRRCPRVAGPGAISMGKGPMCSAADEKLAVHKTKAMHTGVVTFT